MKDVFKLPAFLMSQDYHLLKNNLAQRFYLQRLIFAQTTQ